MMYGMESLTSNTPSVMLLLITLHPNLVRADNGSQTVVIAEALCYIRTELHSYTSLRWPTSWLSLWICPQHLHHQARMSRLPLIMPVQLPDIIQRNLIIAK